MKSKRGFIKIFAVLVLFSRIIHFLPSNYDFGTFFYCLFAELHDNESAIGACVLLQFLFFIPSSIIQKSQFFSLCFINTTTMFRLCLSFCALGVGRISSLHHRKKSLRYWIVIVVICISDIKKHRTLHQIKIQGSTF